MRNKGDMLDRIVILLLALADLAERAARAPAPIRCLVLWPLRRAEAVAEAFVAGLAFDAAYRPIGSSDRLGCDPADALAVALSLRALALTLQAIAEQLRRSSRHGGVMYQTNGSFHRHIQALGHAACPQVTLPPRSNPD